MNNNDVLKKNGNPQDADVCGNDLILTFREFMNFIKVGKTTMYKIMHSPRAPKFTQIGSIKIITRADAEKWVQNNAGLKII